MQTFAFDKKRQKILLTLDRGLSDIDVHVLRTEVRDPFHEGQDARIHPMMEILSWDDPVTTPHLVQRKSDEVHNPKLYFVALGVDIAGHRNHRCRHQQKTSK